jgi:hypothetical protein
MNELEEVQAAYDAACHKALQADLDVAETKQRMLTVELRVTYGVAMGDSVEWVEPEYTKIKWGVDSFIVPHKIWRGKILSYNGGAITVLLYRRDGSLGSKEKRVFIMGRPELGLKKIVETGLKT